MMRLKRGLILTAVLSILSALPFCVLATAGTLTYTEQGNLSGSLGGTPFTNAQVTFTLAGTPSSIHVSGDTFWDVFPVGAATVTIAGIPGTATISNIAEVVAFQCTSSCADPAAAFAFDFPSIGVFTIMGTSNPAFGVYDLTTPIGPLSGVAFGTAPPFLDTDKGQFVISSYSGGTSTFTAFTEVPEPESLGLLAIGAALLLAARRRLAR